MLKSALQGILIAMIAGAICLIIFVIGLYNAPDRLPYDEMDHVQITCDASRREPWKPEISTSCEYMQDFFAIDYKCEKIRGCFAIARADYGENSDQRQ